MPRLLSDACKFAWLILVFLVACGEREDRTDRNALAQEMRGRKLKRVTEAQIMGLAAEEGIRAVSQLQPLLIIPASGNCDSIRINGTLTNKVVVEYRFVCRQTPDLHPKAQEIWEAYNYNVQQNIAIAENIQKLDNKQLLYTSPIHHQGKFIGMWSIVLDKKEMIRRL